MEALEFQNQPIDYIFSTFAPQRKEIGVLQDYALGMGIKKIAMVWDQDPYSTMMMRLFREAIPAHGMAVTDEHETPTGTQDFRTIIVKNESEKS
jgi:ABC-type branched-subunit amino acid transport system substrate-binding protein